jgi:retron-type reverse transcriptase
LGSGVVPSQFKIAKVIPVYKSGDKTNPDNYRPISLLSSFSKILEKVVAIRLTSFLDCEKILSKFQFGFRKSHSTSHAMVLFMNSISQAINAKKHTIAIFCDLRKAFDTVDHSILLKKCIKWAFVTLSWHGLKTT